MINFYYQYLFSQIYQTASSEPGSVKVKLNVYDLNPINLILSPVGVGLYHSGIEINDTEYSFASKAGGIFRIEPKKARGVRFREQIEIGRLEEGEEELDIERALEVLRPNFQPSDYDLVTRNCNHFCDAFLQEILGKQLPGHVNRMSNVWTTANIEWVVPKTIRQSAPTGEKSLKAYKGLLPFLESILEVSTLVVREWVDSSNSIAKVVSTSKGLSLLLDDHTVDMA